MQDVSAAASASRRAPPAPAWIGVIEGIVLLAVGAVIAIDRSHWHRWSVLLGSLLIATAVSTVIYYPIGRLVGITGEVVSVGTGAALARLRIGRTWWKIGWLLISGYVRFPQPIVTTAFDPHASSFREPDQRTVEELNPLARIVLMLSGPAAALILGAMLLGVSKSRSIFAAVPHDLIGLFSAPTRSEILRRFMALLDHASRGEAIGGFSIYYAFLNLIPLPFCSGGLALIVAIETLRGRSISRRWLTIAQVLSLFVVLIAAILFGCHVAIYWLS